MTPIARLLRSALLVVVLFAECFEGSGERCGCLQKGYFGDSFCGQHWTPEGEVEELWCYADIRNECESNTSGVRAGYPLIPFLGKDNWVACDVPNEPEYLTNYTESFTQNVGEDPIHFILFCGGNNADTRKVQVIGSKNKLILNKISFYFTEEQSYKSIQYSKQEISLKHNPVSSDAHSLSDLLAVGTDSGYLYMFQAASRGPGLELALIDIVENHHLHTDWGWYQEEVKATSVVSNVAVNDEFVAAAFGWWVVVLRFSYTHTNKQTLFHLQGQVFSQKIVDRRGSGIAIVTGLALTTSNALVITATDGSVRLYHYENERNTFIYSEMSVQTELPPPLTKYPPKNSVGYQEIVTRTGLNKAITTTIPPDAGYPAKGIRRYSVVGGLHDDAWWRSGTNVKSFSQAWGISTYAVVGTETNDGDTIRNLEIFKSQQGNGQAARNYHASFNITAMNETDNSSSSFPPTDDPFYPDGSNDTLPFGAVCWTSLNPRGNQRWEGWCVLPYNCLPFNSDFSTYTCQDPAMYEAANEAGVMVGVSSNVYTLGIVVGSTVTTHTAANELLCVSQWDCTHENEKRFDCTWYDSTGMASVTDCVDGTTCSGCDCSGHGGIARCPPESPLMCVSTECFNGNGPCCSTNCDNLSGERECAGPLGRYRPMSTPICIPGTQHIQTLDECKEISLVLAENFTVLNGSSTDPSCYHADGVVTWNPLSSLFAAPLPSNITSLYSMMANTSVSPRIPYVKRELFWRDLEACLAECYLDASCGGATFAEYQENCTFYTSTVMGNASNFEESFDADLYVLATRDVLKAARVFPNETGRANQLTSFCESDNWVLGSGSSSSSSCQALAMWSIISHMECIRAVENLVERSLLVLNTTFVTPIPLNYLNPGCVVNVKGGYRWVTFNPYVSTGIFEPLSEGFLPVCATEEDPNRPTPIPDQPVSPTPEPKPVSRKLFYLPLWVYIVLMHVIGLSLLAVAVFFNRTGRRGPLRWARPEPELAEELVASYKKRFDQLLESFAVVISADDTIATCTVCLEDLIEGCIELPCGHQLHLQCMQDYITHQVTKRRRKTAKCPNCRHPVELPAEDPEDPAHAYEDGEGEEEEEGHNIQEVVEDTDVEMQTVLPETVEETALDDEASGEADYTVLS